MKVTSAPLRQLDHSESTLPKWAQERLLDLRQDLAATKHQLLQTLAAHAVLQGRPWFTLPGPPPCEAAADPLASRKLFWLHRDGAQEACTIYPGDVLLVGRSTAAKEEA